MKLKIVFTAEISEDIGDVPADVLYTDEQNKAMLVKALKEMTGESAQIIVHDFKLTQMS